MPDIAMCEGIGCDIREQCYRHTAEPNPYRQTYYAVPPKDEDGNCNEFIANEELRKARKEFITKLQNDDW